MKIFVKAKANAKQQKVTQISGNSYLVAVKEPPVDGRANQAIADALAEHFGVPRRQVRLIGGATAKQKLFEL